MPDLDERIRRLEKRTQHMPVRWAGGAAVQLASLATVGRGNTIGTFGGGGALYGIAYSTAAITAINAAEIAAAPNITPVLTDGIYQSGLTWATLVSGMNVFLAHIVDPPGATPPQQDAQTPLAIPERAQLWVRRSVLLPHPGNPLIMVPVYLTWRA